MNAQLGRRSRGNKLKTVNFRIPDEMHAFLKDLKAQTGKGMADVFRDLVNAKYGDDITILKRACDNLERRHESADLSARAKRSDSRK